MSAMTATTAEFPPTPDLGVLIAEVEVRAVRRLSPSFARFELGGPGLADFGVDGPLHDQRLKLVLPGEGGRPPSFAGADESWYAAWLARPAEERGHMRTYTVRDVVGTGAGTRLVIDIVIHPHQPDSGPGARWAAKADVGDRVVVVAPRRGVPFGGIEFAPGAASHLLLAGDETAVPAVSSILEGLPQTARGVAFLEVPHADDVLGIDGPAGVEVVWLPRRGAPWGAPLSQAVARHLGPGGDGDPAITPPEVDADLWETPTYSSSGESIQASGDAAIRHEGLYAWIAGESGVVTGLRRLLVREHLVPRRQVAFMGYWRRGVPMKS